MKKDKETKAKWYRWMATYGDPKSPVTVAAREWLRQNGYTTKRRKAK